MSSTNPIQCLFCKHSNLPGVSFCSVCDAQLDLQPCERCGAVDNRAAKKCHKCGSEFAILAQSEFEAKPEPAPQIAAGISYEGGATRNQSHRRWWFFGVPLLLSLIVFSAFVIHMQPAKLLPPKQATQALPAESNGSAPSTIAAPVEPTVKPAVKKSTPPPQHSAPAAIKETASGQISPPTQECPQPVATLGLCNPEIK